MPEAADDLTRVVDAVLTASRALVGVAARALADLAPQVSLPQLRVLVVLAGRGPLPAAVLAETLGVTPSTVTRMTDRLVHKGLVSRRASREDRRQVRIGLTRHGREVMDEVTRRRREALGQILAGMPRSQQLALVPALEAFAAAAGEPPAGATGPAELTLLGAARAGAPTAGGPQRSADGCDDAPAADAPAADAPAAGAFAADAPAAGAFAAATRGHR